MKITELKRETFLKMCNSGEIAHNSDNENWVNELIQIGYDFCKKEYEEKLRWISTIEQTPTATEIGDWDGKRSDFVLAKTKNGSHYILRVYEGFSNGEKWVDWADKNDMLHTEIVEWRSFL